MNQSNFTTLAKIIVLVAIVTRGVIGNAQQESPEKWPEKPKTVESLMVDSTGGGKIPLLEVQAPVLTAPPNDLLAKITADPWLDGKLVYAPLLYAQPESKPYVVFRSTGATKQGLDRISDVASYPAQSVGLIFNPRFSPNGNMLLLQVGSPFDRYGTYQTVIWNFEKRTLQPIAGALLYENMLWSPDGRYVAYIKGGDKAGYQSRGDEQVTLNIFEVGTGKNRVVARNPSVSSEGSWSWSTQNMLLFTMPPQQQSDKNNKPADADGNKDLKSKPRPSIYEVSAQGGEARQIIKAGYNPLASPDGKSIAFFGWPSGEQNNEKSQPVEGMITEPSLYIFGKQDESRKEIFGHGNGTLRWVSDNKTLLNLVILQSSQKVGTVAVLSAFDSETFQRREVKKLQANDYRAVIRNLTTPQFELRQVTRDNSSVLIKVSEYTGKDHGFYTENMTLQAINLITGDITQVAQINNKWGSVVGWDWQEN